MNPKVHYVSERYFSASEDATVFVTECGWAPSLDSRKKPIKLTKKISEVTCERCKNELGMQALSEVP